MSELSEETCADLVKAMSQLIRAGRARSAKWAHPSEDEPGLTITSPLFAILGILGTAGEMRMQAVAARTGSDVSVVSRQVAALEDAGCVARRVDEQDRRVTMLSLTGRGRERHAAGLKQRVDLFRGAMRNWSETDASTLLTLIDRVNKDLLDLTD